MTDRYRQPIDFTTLQSVTPQQIGAWRAMVNAQPHDRVLDAMSGPGTGSKYIAEAQPQINLALMDSSEAMLQAGAKSIAEATGIEPFLIHANFMTHAPALPYDIILLRSAIHEVPKDQQAALFEQTRKHVWLGGRVVAWQQTMPDDPAHAELLRALIRERDEIGGYSLQRAQRYFPTQAELLTAASASFGAPTQVVAIDPQQFHSAIIADQDFKGDDRAAKLARLNQYMRTAIPESARAALGYQDYILKRAGQPDEECVKVDIPVMLYEFTRSR